MVVEVGGRARDEDESFLDWDGQPTLFDEEIDEDDDDLDEDDLDE